MRMPRSRHLRRRRFNRVRYPSLLKQFLIEKADELFETGADYVFTVDPQFATATLVLAEIPTDGEIVTIGNATYRFKNALQQAYDVLISPYVAAQGVFALDGVIISGDTITIGARTYTFVTALTSPAEADEVLVGNGGTEALANFAAAINAGEGEGVVYSEGTVVSSHVSAIADATSVVVTALVPGADENSLSLSATIDGDSDWTEATLTSGYTPDTDDIVANLVAAITGDEGEGTLYGNGTVAHSQVTAEEDDGDMVVTAIFAGDEGNNIAVSTNATDGSWGEDVVALEGGNTAASNLVTITAHGLTAHTGPFVITAGDDLPLGITEDGLYWIHSVVDVNTVRLNTKKGSLSQLSILSGGDGTLTLLKADTEAAILEYIRQNPVEVVRDADDVDDL